MIDYSYDEEKLTALYFADVLNDRLIRKTIAAGVVVANRNRLMRYT